MAKVIDLTKILPILQKCYSDYNSSLNVSKKLIEKIVELTHGRLEMYDSLIYKNFNSYLVDFKNTVNESFKNDESAPNYELGAEFAHIYYSTELTEETQNLIQKICDKCNDSLKFAKLTVIKFPEDNFISVDITSTIPIATEDIRYH